MGAAYARGAGGHAAAFGDDAPHEQHAPVPGRALLGGASKLSYPLPGNPGGGQQGGAAQGEAAADMESRPSAANWGSWGATD